MSTEVPEFSDPAIREIYYGSYRIIFHYDGKRALILTVWHASKLLNTRLILRDS